MDRGSSGEQALMDDATTVIRPRWWTLPVTALGCLVFVVAGLAMIASGQIGAIVIGVLAVAFFGGGGLVAMVRMRRADRALAVGPDGVEIRDRGNRIPIAWDEVVDMGVFSTVGGGGNKLTGLRLRDPAAFAARLDASGSVPRLLSRTGGTAGMVRANRGLTGWDVAFGWADRDRSARALLELFERERAIGSGRRTRSV